MYLNLIGLSLIGIFFAYLGYYAWKPLPIDFNPVRYGLLVAQDTGKTKHVVSKTGDVSMQTELRRRRAIQTVGIVEHKFKANLGSVSGAVETYMISGICICPKICDNNDIIFDGGGATDEFCPIHGDSLYDAGGADTTVCGV
jgi:hypothetical protein